MCEVRSGCHCGQKNIRQSICMFSFITFSDFFESCCIFLASEIPRKELFYSNYDDEWRLVCTYCNSIGLSCILWGDVWLGNFNISIMILRSVRDDKNNYWTV